jgi:hypothetical protein
MRVAVAALLVVSAAWIVPTAARAEVGWSLRAGGIGTSYEKHGGTGYFDYHSHLDLDGGFGPYAAAELRVDRWFGVELSTAKLDLDAHYRETQTVPISFNPTVLREVTRYEADGKYTLKPLALALLFHLRPDRRVSLYVGPQVARVSFANDIGSGPRDPEMGYGGKAGVEVRFGDSPWAAAAEVGRLEIQHENGSDHDLYGNFGLATASALIVFRGR